jgi:rhodanese-related sulfurtransferase
MQDRRFVLSAALIAAALLLAAAFTAGAATVPRMSTDELKLRLGEVDLVVLDVRGNWDWDKSGEKIAGAERVNPAEAEQWAGNYPREKTLVLYCA